MSIEQHGVGFAFFRWHCLTWPFTGCRGWSDPHSFCDENWEFLNPGSPSTSSGESHG